MSLSTSLSTALLAGSLVALGGCSSLDDSWKSTKEFYRTYINAPATINYEEQGTLSDAEVALASRMVGIDIQLEQLERFLQNADRPPSPEVVSVFFQRFPWISGLAAVDTSGVVLAQEPAYSMKQLDFSALVAQEARKGEMRGIRGLVEETALGAEVLAGVPVYADADLKGFFVAHFDMRALLSYTSGADDLIVVSPQGVLWSGRFSVENTPLAGQDWASLAKKSTQGVLSNAEGEFIWISRYIGKQPLIFATPVKGQGATAPLSEKTSHAPITEDQVIENNAGSLLLAPLPPVRDLGMQERAISK